MVTPGWDRDLERIAANRFPTFRWDRGLTFRYMRYWIEQGHARAQVPLGEDAVAAMDALDRELARTKHVLQFRLNAGEMLWIDNRMIARGRDAYRDDPLHPRLPVRLWIARDESRSLKGAEAAIRSSSAKHLHECCTLLQSVLFRPASIHFGFRTVDRRLKEKRAQMMNDPKSNARQPRQARREALITPALYQTLPRFSTTFGDARPTCP